MNQLHIVEGKVLICNAFDRTSSDVEGRIQCAPSVMAIPTDVGGATLEAR